MENNEMTEALNTYTSTLEMSKPDYLRMVYDSYLEFDNEELENYMNDKSNTKVLDKNKGFYSTFEQFSKGYENDKWNNLMIKIMTSLKGNDSQEATQRNTLEIKQLTFLQPEEIPLKPTVKRTNMFNFKSKYTKIISFSTNSTIKEDKIKKHIKDTYINTETESVLRLIDFHHDNKIMFIDKYFIDFKDDEPMITGLNDFSSLEKRSDILVYSRFTFIEKIAITICKFIIALKKLYKFKKEKDKQKTLGNNTDLAMNSLLKKETLDRLMNTNTNNNNNNILGKDGLDKLKKIKEVISSLPLTIPKQVNKNINDLLDVKKFKKILNKISTEKKNKEKAVEKEKLKQKLKSFFQKKANPDYYYEESEQDDLNEEDEDDDTSNNPITDRSVGVFVLDPSGRRVSKFEEPGTHFERSTKKRKTVTKSQITDAVNEIMEEKVIVPKKKVNHVGLKMFIKDALNKKKNA